jgi:mono/diheme cytochrome c family protein
MKLRKIFSSPGIHETPGRIAIRLYLPALLAMLFLFGTLDCPQLPAKQSSPVPPSGAELFKSKCSTCHDLERALKQYRSKEVWRDAINRMKTEHNADISREEIDQLVKYHVERQQREAAVFKEKCQKCHPGKVFLEQNLTPDQARSIIKRMQQKAGNSIEDKDIEIIVRYHVQNQQAALEKTLKSILGRGQAVQPIMKKGMELFVEKCSSCHNPARALAVIKDPEVWAQTIKRMQQYSKGAISDREARELVDFHVTRQQKEINTFQETCTKCHDDKRINSRSLSEEQWLETIRRMQKKAPELIPDEKVNLLAAYFHRRELTLAKIFAGRCQLCHYFTSGKAIPPGSTQQMNGLIAIANKDLGRSLQITDVNNLLAVHVQRQKRTMQLYESNCTTCHTDGLVTKRESDREKGATPTRADWISFIAALQGVELSKEIQSTINSQIDFHISKH